MSNSMQVTEPVPFCEAAKEIDYAPLEYRILAQTLSPLARAALENGVSFDDVAAYCMSSGRFAVSLYETLTSLESPSGWFDEIRIDAALDGALARSVLAEGTIEHARLWWRGVL